MALFQNNPNKVGKGKVVYNSSIVKGIIYLAVTDIEGVSIHNSGKKDNKNKSISLSFEGSDTVSVDVSVDIEYGYNVPDLAFVVQENIKHSIESMSRYKVSNVNIYFDTIKFNENVGVV